MKSLFSKSNCIAFCMFVLNISQMMTHVAVNISQMMILVAINITNKVVSAVFIPFTKLQNLTL